MTIFNLPLLDDSEPVMEGAIVARENRFSGIVSTDGSNFWLYRFDDLVDAVRQDPSQPLSQISRREVKVLHTMEAAAGGLDLADPKTSVIEYYLNSRKEEVLLAGVSKNQRLVYRTADLLMLQKMADIYTSVTAKSYKCSKGNEIIDEDQLPMDGKCRRHKDGVYMVQP